MGLETISSRDDYAYPVDSTRYILVVIDSDADIASGDFDVTVEAGEELIGDKLNDLEYEAVGKLLTTIADKYFGYSQAREILQGLYGGL